MIRRRELITLLGGAAVAWPLVARAQRAGRLPRIGYLAFTSASYQSPGLQAFLAGLRDLGYVEGKNIEIEFRFADGNSDLLARMAAELVRSNVDLIVTYATGVDAARRATATVPIVMATHGDALATGIVASLSHPGGNITGSTFFNPQLMAKRLELVKEAAPSLDRAGVFLFRGSDANGSILEAMGEVTRALRIDLQPIEIDRSMELEGAFSALLNQRTEAFVVGDHAFFLANANAISALSTKHRLLSIGPLELSRGLIAYGVNFNDQFRRAAVFVDKILKGAKPGDIPVEQATKFKTIVNLKTAKDIGVTLPTSILLRADEVIE